MRQPPQVKGRNLERSQSLRLTHSGCIMYITSWFFKQIVLHQERICSISNLYYAPDNDCRFTVLHLQCSVRLLSKLRLLLAAALNLFQASAAAVVFTTILSKISLPLLFTHLNERTASRSSFERRSKRFLSECSTTALETLSITVLMYDHKNFKARNGLKLLSLVTWLTLKFQSRHTLSFLLK